jgi:hypothetical protein
MSDCLSECQAYMNQCSAALSGFLSCATSANWQCDADGEPTVLGCDAQATTANQCIGCVLSPLDTPCEQCGKSNCCTQLKAVYAAPDYLALFRCLEGCTTDQCRQNCENQYPSAAAPYQTLIGCVVSSCSAQCA